MGVRYDKISFRAGDSWPAGNSSVLTLVFREGPDVNHLSAVDLTSATVSAAICASFGGATVATPVVTKANQTTDPGKFTFRIPASESVKLRARTYHYAITLSWASDSKLTVLYGVLRVSDE